MTHQDGAKLLGWLLFPLALLGGLIFLLLLLSLFAPADQYHGAWEGQRSGNSDWLGPFLVPAFLVYLLVGLGVWWRVISFAYASDKTSPRPSTVWRSLLGFNVLASLFWIFLSIHIHNDNTNGYLLCLLPLIVTIPVASVAGRFLFKSRP